MSIDTPEIYNKQRNQSLSEMKRERDSITLFSSFNKHQKKPHRNNKKNHLPMTNPVTPRHDDPNYTAELSRIRTLSSALTDFLDSHDDLQTHLVQIISTVDSNLIHPFPISHSSKPILTVDSNPTPFISTADIEPTQSLISTVDTKLTPLISTADIKPTQPLISTVDSKLTPPISTVDSKQTSGRISTVDSKITTAISTVDLKSGESEIESLCKRSIGREVRRYVSNHLLNPVKLRKEVPRALKRASNPAQLVINAIGRFYLQGIKAFDKNSPMVPARKVSVLILEFYLLMDRDGTHLEETTKREAHQAAVDWRKRLMTEGGCVEADKMDGRGLLLLVGGFGIPKEFTSSDIRDLILAGSVGEISDAIRRSSVLVERVPGIIERMMKIKKDPKAVDIIYAFGMENKFAPQPFLASFVEGSLETWNKEKKAAHDSLKAQRDADKRHLADLRSVLSCLKKHKLNSFEILPNCPLIEKIATLEREIADINKKIEDQMIEKRRLELKPIRRSEPREDWRDEKRTRLSDHTPRQHIDRDYLDGRISSDRFTPIRVLDSTFPGHLYSPPYEIHRSLPEIRGGGAFGHTIANNGEAYRLLEDDILRERILRERELVQSYTDPSSLGGLYMPTNSLEGFARGLSNPLGIGSSNRAQPLDSDIYHFADAVAERELFRGARDVPSVVPSHRLPRLY